MTDLIILKALFILVMGTAATKLHACAGGSTRYSGDWYAGHVLSVLLGIMAISELAHLIAFVRGVQP